jgi:hypothetical protein
MLSSLSIMSFDFLNLECLNNNGGRAYFIAVYLWCILPILLGVVIVVLGVLRYEIQAVGMPAIMFKSRKQIESQHVWMLLFLSYIVLPPVSNRQLGVFDCITLVSGKRYLRSDTSIDCDSWSYQEFSTHVVMFVIAYQLIPIVWILLLYRHRESLNPPTSQVDERLAVYIRNKNEDLTSLKFLFEDYKCSKWWFEVVDMYRRITFIGILPLVSPDSAIRSSFGLVLSIASVAYFREEQPYCEDFTNVIAHIAQVIFYLIILILILFFKLWVMMFYRS